MMYSCISKYMETLSEDEKIEYKDMIDRCKKAEECSAESKKQNKEMEKRITNSVESATKSLETWGRKAGSVGKSLDRIITAVNIEEESMNSIKESIKSIKTTDELQKSIPESNYKS